MGLAVGAGSGSSSDSMKALGFMGSGPWSRTQVSQRWKRKVGSDMQPWRSRWARSVSF